MSKNDVIGGRGESESVDDEGKEVRKVSFFDDVILGHSPTLQQQSSNLSAEKLTSLSTPFHYQESNYMISLAEN